MSKLKFPTLRACRIADIGRDRFNEAVAAGNYPCAPEVVPGATRLFNESQLIALFYYGRLNSLGWPPKLAGKIACQLSNELEKSPSANEVSIYFHSGDGTMTFTDEQHIGDPRRTIGSMFVWHRLSIDVENIRTIVRGRIEDDLTIVSE